MQQKVGLAQVSVPFQFTSHGFGEVHLDLSPVGIPGGFIGPAARRVPGRILFCSASCFIACDFGCQSVHGALRQRRDREQRVRAQRCGDDCAVEHIKAFPKSSATGFEHLAMLVHHAVFNRIGHAASTQGVNREGGVAGDGGRQHHADFFRQEADGRVLDVDRPLSIDLFQVFFLQQMCSKGRLARVSGHELFALGVVGHAAGRRIVPHGQQGLGVFQAHSLQYGPVGFTPG